MDNIMNTIENNKTRIAIFLNLSRAFDTIDHHILFRKLELCTRIYAQSSAGDKFDSHSDTPPAPHTHAVYKRSEFTSPTHSHTAKQRDHHSQPNLAVCTTRQRKTRSSYLYTAVYIMYGFLGG